METRARYAVIGAFVLAVILGAFVFVYWIQNIGGIGARSIYRVEFDNPVSGLTAGSNVLFNGIRVGAVTDLMLDADNPKRVNATISIDPKTPLHADTRVDINFQGLTGSPAIALIGGSATSPRLTAKKGEIPVLRAGPGVGLSLSEEARQALSKLETLIDDNAKPLHTAITGLSTFADMLGRNSERIETMIGGLEKMIGAAAPKAPPAIFDLDAPTTFPAMAKAIKGQMTVNDPNAVLVFDTQKILVRSATGTYSNLENAQWADNLPKLVQAKVIQSFENAHQLSKVSRPFEQLQAQYKLEIGIRNFQISMGPKPTAVVEFTARLLDDKGNVVNARLFNASVPVAGDKPEQEVAALNEAFSKTAQDLVVWTVDLI